MSDSIVPPLKRCSQCGQNLPATLEFFYKRGNRACGLSSRCKDCEAVVNGRKRRKPIAPVSQDGMRRCSRCLMEFPQTLDYFLYTKRGYWHSICRQCGREKSKIYREAHKDDSIYRERRRASDRLRYKKQSIEIREWQKNYRQNHPDRVREAKNLTKHAINQRNRATRKRKLPVLLTAHNWQDALVYWHDCCAYCGSQQGFWNPICIEHFIPLSSPHCPGTIPTNIVPACKSCNSSKQDKDPYEWLIWKFGKREAQQILKRIEDYFASLT